MKKFVSIFVIVIVIVIVLTGCASTRQVQVVREVSRDTLYLSNVQYDSIYVYQDHHTDRSRDTIYVKDVQYEYKYKLLRDTVYKVQIDTIPVIRKSRSSRPNVTSPRSIKHPSGSASFYFVYSAYSAC